MSGRDPVVVVSGLPRSGTSMMMSMLAAGGLPILSDEIRGADEDNPRGYYEFEPVKQLEHDSSWVDVAAGKVVKVISQLVQHLPPQYEYKVVFMLRNMAEVLASQRQMLIRRGRPADAVSDEILTQVFGKHLSQVREWIEAQPNIQVLYVDYGEVLTQPAEQAQRVNQFLGGVLNEQAMASVVDKRLHRQRR
jgi:broad-specificity NMP kinase